MNQNPNQPQPPQAPQQNRPSVGERLPEEKKTMQGFLQQLSGMLIPTTNYAEVVRELLLEQIDNAEYQLLQISPQDNPALYSYLMGMVFWYRGYQTEAGQQFELAMQNDPQNEVFRKTYQYQWAPQSARQKGKGGKGSSAGDCCCECVDCIHCCTDCSSCLGS